MMIQKLIHNEKLTHFFKNFFTTAVQSAYVSRTEDANDSNDDDLREESQKITDVLSQINLSSNINAVDFKSVIVLDVMGDLVELTMVPEATSMIFAKVDKSECVFIK